MHWEMWALGLALEPAEVLEAATIGNATYLGLDADLGSIEPGKKADLVVLSKNPLENLEATVAAVLVMKDGIAYDPVSLTAWPADVDRNE